MCGMGEGWVRVGESQEESSCCKVIVGGDVLMGGRAESV